MRTLGTLDRFSRFFLGFSVGSVGSLVGFLTLVVFLRESMVLDLEDFLRFPVGSCTF